MVTTSEERIRDLGTGGDACVGLKRELYNCLKREAKSDQDATKGRADEYGRVADRLDPQGAETARRARQMANGGASGNANGASSGASGNANGGASGNGAAGDQKKGDEKGGQQGASGGDPSAATKLAEQAMKAAQDQKAKEEQERKEAEAKRKAEEERVRQEKIADCTATKDQLMRAIQDCKNEFNTDKAAAWVFIKREECIKGKQSIYAPITEDTVCASLYPRTP